MNQLHMLIENPNFIADGIINPELYGKSTKPGYTGNSLKILWILKEPNSSETGWTFQQYLSMKTIENKINLAESTIAYPIFKKMLYTSYGILNGLPDYAMVPDISYPEVYGVGERIAYINIKKTGGGSSATFNSIKAAYQENREMLMDQIQNCNPNIIIFGNTLCFFDAKDLNELGWNPVNKFYSDESTSNTACYDISAERLIIDAYHPAYWKISQETYYTEIIGAVRKWNSLYGR